MLWLLKHKHNYLLKTAAEFLKAALSKLFVTKFLKLLSDLWNRFSSSGTLTRKN